MNPTFSVCIPNFNYGHYLPETLRSVLDQEFTDLEVIVADNCSTDNSVEVVNQIGDPRVRLIENRRNIGFAGNLDRATETATGRFMLVLSADDLMRPTALGEYARVFNDLGEKAESAVLTSALDVIDGDGHVVGALGRRAGSLEYEEATSEQAVRAFSSQLEVRPGVEALQFALRHKSSPAAFAATCYSRRLYDSVGGYRSPLRIWPDGFFLNKLLSEDVDLVYVPQRLFAYRVHAENQNSQDRGPLIGKYQIDSYIHTTDFPEAVLERVGVSRTELVDAFIEHAILRRGFHEVERGEGRRARALLVFGSSIYPGRLWRRPAATGLAALALTGPLGRAASASIRRRRRR